MMDAPVVYAVRMWLNPVGGEKVIAWLDGGHHAEVAAQPGFLWAKRYRLAQNAEDGWHGYLMLYGLKSQAALDAYFKSPIHEKFSRENKPFLPLIRTDRVWGALDFAVASGEKVAS
jgi:hypothetical protein